MARKLSISLVMALFSGLLFNGWGHSHAAIAAERLVPIPQTPTSEGTQVGLDLLPPLPFSGATMDLGIFGRVCNRSSLFLDSVGQAIQEGTCETAAPVPCE